MVGVTGFGYSEIQVVGDRVSGRWLGQLLQALIKRHARRQLVRFGQRDAQHVIHRLARRGNGDQADHGDTVNSAVGGTTDGALTSSGQIFCHLSGHNSLRQTRPPVAFSMAWQYSTGTLRKRQLPSLAELTPIFFARTEGPPHS